jgi:hypothetical protein
LLRDDLGRLTANRWLQVCAPCGLRRYRAMARTNKEKLGAGASASPPRDGRCSPNAT